MVEITVKHDGKEKKAQFIDHGIVGHEWRSEMVLEHKHYFSAVSVEEARLSKLTFDSGGKCYSGTAAYRIYNDIATFGDFGIDIREALSGD